MSISWLNSFVGLGLLTLPILATAADDAAKPIALDLKSFTFKVPETQADLFGYDAGEDRLFFYTNGTGEAKVKVPDDGDYEIVVKASGDIALKEGAKFKVAVDGKQAGKETETTGESKEYKFPTPLKTGEHKVSIEFTNDIYKEGEYDRNLYLHAVTLKKLK
jgi:Ca-dependent carbohydrate-binding module xylan-binding